jgi:hypothetical protein
MAEAGPISEGVRYSRAVAVIGTNVVLVLDLVDARRENTFDLAYHNAGAWSDSFTGEEVRPPKQPGYHYLEGLVKWPPCRD